jgi:hypothetical protein
VTTDVASLQPLPAWAAEWWAAENVPTDLPIAVHADSDVSVVAGPRGLMGRYFAWVGELLSSTWQRTFAVAVG